MYKLTIYGNDTRTVLRQTTHKTKAQAFRSRDDYERRNGRKFSSDVSALPMPDASDAQAWDDYRRKQGYSGAR